MEIIPPSAVRRVKKVLVTPRMTAALISAVAAVSAENLFPRAADCGFYLASAARLLFPTTNCFDDLADGVNNKLRLLLMYLVAAIRVGDVLCVGHKLGELFLRFFLRGIRNVPEVWWNIIR
jgi:hypothetical protein